LQPEQRPTNFGSRAPPKIVHSGLQSQAPANAAGVVKLGQTIAGVVSSRLCSVTDSGFAASPSPYDVLQRLPCPEDAVTSTTRRALRYTSEGTQNSFVCPPDRRVYLDLPLFLIHVLTRCRPGKPNPAPGSDKKANRPNKTPDHFLWKRNIESTSLAASALIDAGAAQRAFGSARPAGRDLESATGWPTSFGSTTADTCRH
jgi:hypothetical protein